ncbi:MAG: 4Fe-4S binding protein [Planctomycetes bacterium]|nr:4Fe-4S binding protein [Planctomycetota bacterium]
MVAMEKKTRLKLLVSKLLPQRMWVQSVFLMIWLNPFGLRMHGMCSPVLHCYACPLASFACPIGVIAQLSAIHIFPFIAIGLLIVMGTFFGSLLCGWACPFGFLQDMAAKVSTPRFKLPKWTGHFRYVVLIITVLAIPYFFGEEHWLFFCQICPAGALEAAVPNMVNQAMASEKIIWPNAIKLTIFILFLVTIFFVNRPWCRILCPLGGIFSIFNRVSVFFLQIGTDKCNDCKRCHNLCEYGIEPDKTPNDTGCIRCLECTKCVPEAITPANIFEQTKVMPTPKKKDV